MGEVKYYQPPVCKRLSNLHAVPSLLKNVKYTKPKVALCIFVRDETKEYNFNHWFNDPCIAGRYGDATVLSKAVIPVKIPVV